MKKSHFKVVLAPRALEALDAIEDPLTRKVVIGGIEDLKQMPDIRGKALAGELDGYRGLKVPGTGFRIIYRVEGELVTVYIVAGRERSRMVMKMSMEAPPPNVHSLTRRMIQTRLLDIDNLDD